MSEHRNEGMTMTYPLLGMELEYLALVPVPTDCICLDNSLNLHESPLTSSKLLWTVVKPNHCTVMGAHGLSREAEVI